MELKQAGSLAGWPLLVFALLERILEFIKSGGEDAHWQQISESCQASQVALTNIIEGLIK